MGRTTWKQRLPILQLSWGSRPSAPASIILNTRKVSKIPSIPINFRTGTAETKLSSFFFEVCTSDQSSCGSRGFIVHRYGWIFDCVFGEKTIGGKEKALDNKV